MQMLSSFFWFEALRGPQRRFTEKGGRLPDGMKKAPGTSKERGQGQRRETSEHEKNGHEATEYTSQPFSFHSPPNGYLTLRSYHTKTGFERVIV